MEPQIFAGIGRLDPNRGIVSSKPYASGTTSGFRHASLPWAARTCRLFLAPYSDPSCDRVDLDCPMLNQILPFLTGLPPFSIYFFLGAGAALENIVPPVPADTFVVLGGFLAAQGMADPFAVFFATWGANVASALIVYAAGARYGPEFFRRGLGRFLLDSYQLERIRGFYDRWGHWAIFLTRFLPGFRAAVPVFAGVTHQRFLPVAFPLAVASAIWYGFLTFVGTVTGRNLETILGWVSGLNRTLLVIALILAAGLAYLWYRSRHVERS